MAYSDQMWKDAKQKCHLNDDDIAIAKRLGINPRSLIKNIPSKSELWKAPVKDWLRAMDDKVRVKAEQKAKRKTKAAAATVDRALADSAIPDLKDERRDTQ